LAGVDTADRFTCLKRAARNHTNERQKSDELLDVWFSH
jgi:hypothetical protein